MPKLTPGARRLIQGVKTYLNEKDKTMPPKQYQPSTVLVRVRKPSKKTYA